MQLRKITITDDWYSLPEWPPPAASPASGPSCCGSSPGCWSASQCTHPSCSASPSWPSRTQWTPPSAVSRGIRVGCATINGWSAAIPLAKACFSPPNAIKAQLGSGSSGRSSLRWWFPHWTCLSLTVPPIVPLSFAWVGRSPWFPPRLLPNTVQWSAGNHLFAV